MACDLPAGMRGEVTKQASMLCLVSPETRVPKDHPLRGIKKLADEALRELEPVFAGMYAAGGRPSVPPERLLKSLLSSEHFSVDGTLIEAWASMKSFRPKDEDDDGKGDGNGWADFKGQKRSNETHQSQTDPEARLMRKGLGKEARLCFSGHALMENRNALLVDVLVAEANGFAERDAALEMLDRSLPGRRRITLGADKGYDVSEFVQRLRDHDVTPHIAQTTGPRRRSAIDRRTTSLKGYGISQVIRRRIESIFGWGKTFGGLRRSRYRGIARTQLFAFVVGAAYNLLRVAKLLACPDPA